MALIAVKTDYDFLRDYAKQRWAGGAWTGHYLCLDTNLFLVAQTYPTQSGIAVFRVAKPAQIQIGQ